MIFIVFPHSQKYFSVIFSLFKRIRTIKNPFEPPYIGGKVKLSALTILLSY